MDSIPAASCRPSKRATTGRWRFLSFVALFLVFCTVPLAAQPSDRGWVCPPCDHGGHDEVYAEPGPCPICGMELERAGDLVEAPPLVAKDVVFRNGDIRLTGVVLSSLDGVGEPAPGIVVIHGSGTSDRTQTWASDFARGLAARGFIVLLPDKRGSGSSGGDWRTASFEDLADDAVAAVAALREVEAVDPDRVGVIGLSQGGHVAPLAGRRSTAVAFVVAVSSSAVPITEQAIDEVEKLAERAGFVPEQVERVNALHRLAIRYGLTGDGWERYAESLERALDGDLAGHGVVEPFPRTREHWVWRWARAVGPYDPLPHWKALRIPALIAYGGEDTQIHVAESVDLLVDASGQRGVPRSVLVFGDSGHGLRDPSTRAIRPDLLDFVWSWVEHQATR